MSKEDDLRDVLDKAAQEIALAQSNPRTWVAWMVYLLSRLEEQANKTSAGNLTSFTEMLAALQDAIRNRANTGGWN